jgi:hypothetical protein
MSEWQPIETAPKDGTFIILARFNEGFAEEVSGGDWNQYPKLGQHGLNGFEAWITSPTHWMPIPPPPARQSEDGR